MIPLARLRAGQALPGAVLGMAVAHFGVGLVTLGITGVQSFKVEQDVALCWIERVEDLLLKLDRGRMELDKQLLAPWRKSNEPGSAIGVADSPLE